MLYQDREARSETIMAGTLRQAVTTGRLDASSRAWIPTAVALRLYVLVTMALRRKCSDD
jgi:hypothetical protein